MKKFAGLIMCLLVGAEAIAGAKASTCKEALPDGRAEYSLTDIKDGLTEFKAVKTVYLKNVSPSSTELFMLRKYFSYLEVEQTADAQMVEQFIKDEGEIIYLKNAAGNEMVITVGWPGDNAAGLIFEGVKQKSGKYFVTSFAEIHDGDIYCKL